MTVSVDRLKVTFAHIIFYTEDKNISATTYKLKIAMRTCLQFGNNIYFVPDALNKRAIIVRIGSV